jgi:hypothetical protein
MNKLAMPLKGISSKRTFVNITLDINGGRLRLVHFQNSISHLRHASHHYPMGLHTRRHLGGT